MVLPVPFGSMGVDHLTACSLLLLLPPNPNPAGRGNLDVKNSIAIDGTDFLATQNEFGIRDYLPQGPSSWDIQGNATEHRTSGLAK